MRTLALVSLLSFLLIPVLQTGCASDDAADDDDSAAGDDDTAAADDDTAAGDDDTAVQTAGITTIEEYLEVYCEYAVDCEIWQLPGACIAAMYDAWFTDCVVADVDDLNTCAEWIATLDCDYQGWIDECDDAFECP